MANQNSTALNFTPLSTLSQAAEKVFDAVNDVHSQPPDYSVAWTDLYAIFRNSRLLVRQANRLNPGPSGDESLRLIAGMMRRDHALIRSLLFLVAIENLLGCGHQNATKVLWTYGAQLENANLISEHFADTEERLQIEALVKANLLAVI
jgi:hypothetical protein